MTKFPIWGRSWHFQPGPGLLQGAAQPALIEPVAAAAPGPQLPADFGGILRLCGNADMEGAFLSPQHNGIAAAHAADQLRQLPRLPGGECRVHMQHIAMATVAFRGQVEELCLQLGAQPLLLRQRLRLGADGLRRLVSGNGKGLGNLPVLLIDPGHMPPGPPATAHHQPHTAPQPGAAAQLDQPHLAGGGRVDAAAGAAVRLSAAHR